MIGSGFRRRIYSTIIIISCLLAWGLSLSGCDYARMTDDEAIDTHEKQLPVMPDHTVPVTDGISMLRTVDPVFLVNPQPFDAASLAAGEEAYTFYCIQCHGPRGDGYGTVGQSFAPLPADLGSPLIQQQSNGELFVKISLGFKRHPPLAYTVSEKDRWAVINYIRSLAKPETESP